MIDDFVQQFLNAPTTKEALGWLRAGTDEDFRSIGELETNEESISLVELIYNAGASEVLAVEIDEFPEGQNTGKLVVKLPDDSAKRKCILDWAGTISQQQGFDPEPDSGQQYVFLMLD